MGCPRDIAPKIVDRKAADVLALNGHQGTLREDVEVFVAEQQASGFTDTNISPSPTVEGDHGRIETRTTTVIHHVKWLRKRHNWRGLKGIVVVESSGEIPGSAPGTEKCEHEIRFYMTSPALPASLPGPIVRSHWAVENSPQGVDGHDLPRLFVPDPNRLCPGQCHHHQTHGP